MLLNLLLHLNLLLNLKLCVLLFLITVALLLIGINFPLYKPAPNNRNDACDSEPNNGSFSYIPGNILTKKAHLIPLSNNPFVLMLMLMMDTRRRLVHGVDQMHEQQIPNNTANTEHDDQNRSYFVLVLWELCPHAV